jgi:CheY-like chemotaxis protein
MNSVSKQNSSLPKSTTVLIVDDEKAGRIMSRVLLSDNPGISGPISILEATNIPEALRVLAQTPVDVVLLDKNVGPIEDEVSQDGIESIPEMRALQQYIKILVITSSQKNKDRARAIQLGAFDFIAKSSDLKIKQQKVAEAVSAAHQAFAAILNGRLGTQQLTTSTPLGGKSVLWRPRLMLSMNFRCYSAGQRDQEKRSLRGSFIGSEPKPHPISNARSSRLTSRRYRPRSPSENYLEMKKALIQALPKPIWAISNLPKTERFF